MRRLLPCVTGLKLHRHLSIILLFSRDCPMAQVRNIYTMSSHVKMNAAG